jgi:hypothetical protein
MPAETKVLVNDIDNDLTNVANWDTGNAFTTGDTLIISDGDYVITDNMDLSASINDLTIHVEEQFTGQIGTSSLPLKIGGTATALFYNGSGCKNFHINATMSECYILGTHPDPDSFTIEGGTTTALFCHGGAGATLRAAGTYTTVIVDGATADLNIENGNTIATIRVPVGIARSATLITTSHLGNGHLYLTGASKTYVTVNLESPGARLYLHCPLSVITKINAWAGTVDGRKGNKKITVTNADAYSQATLMYGGHIVEANAANLFGGARYSGYGSADRKSPMGGVPG